MPEGLKVLPSGKYRVDLDAEGRAKVYDDEGNEIARTDTPNTLVTGVDATIPDDVDWVIVTAPGITLTLPSAASRKRGRSLFIKDESGTITQALANRVRIQPQNGQDVEGDPDGVALIDAYAYVELYANEGTRWFACRWSS